MGADDVGCREHEPTVLGGKSQSKFEDALRNAWGMAAHDMQSIVSEIGREARRVVSNYFGVYGSDDEVFLRVCWRVDTDDDESIEKRGFDR